MCNECLIGPDHSGHTVYSFSDAFTKYNKVELFNPDLALISNRVHLYDKCESNIHDAFRPFISKLEERERALVDEAQKDAKELPGCNEHLFRVLVKNVEDDHESTS